MNSNDSKTLFMLTKYELSQLVSLWFVRVLFKLTGSTAARKYVIALSKKRAMRKYKLYCAALLLHHEFMPADTLIDTYPTENETRSKHRLFIIHYELIGEPDYFTLIMFAIDRWPRIAKALYTFKMERAVRRYHLFYLLENNEPSATMTV